MRVGDRHYRTIWPAADGRAIEIIDQTRLPHRFEIARLESVADVADAIRTMRVRGAPLIGAAAAYGLCLAAEVDPGEEPLAAAAALLLDTRPTAVNLRWALGEMRAALASLPAHARAAAAWRRAADLCDEDVAMNRAIGEWGFPLLTAARDRIRDRRPVNVLTHCNAGWLATVDWGTALAPVYRAFEEGLSVHVWVDETRPRNQGASLTAWELAAHGVPHTLIADNAGGHLMQRGAVDLCIVGTDRTTRTGDVCNKIGTYLKALAARDNGVPFYVAAPGPSIDWEANDGLTQIPIEERTPAEVTTVTGCAPDGRILSVRLAPDETRAANPAFDVTPSRLVTALITERGVCGASASALATLYPDCAAQVRPSP